MGRILVSGFYGRGNAGDEALLQCLYEILSPHHEVAIAIHPGDSRPGFHGWYPYDRCRLLDETAIGHLLEYEPDGVVVGGGGLSSAFSAHLVLTARYLGAATALVGTDNHDLVREGPGPLAFRDYMAGFRYVGLRFGIGVRATRAIGVPAEHGADLAFMLHAAPTPPPVTGRPCAVTVRAWDTRWHDQGFRFHLHALFHGLRAEGYSPFLLPFSPEDTALAGELAPMLGAEVAELWWNPRALKGMMAGCALVVSVGRLHPLIFAAPLGVPVCHVGAPIATEGYGIPGKVVELCRETGVAGFPAVEPFLAALRAGAVGPADPALMASTLARGGRMAASTLAALAAPSDPAAPWMARPASVPGADLPAPLPEPPIPPAKKARPMKVQQPFLTHDPEVFLLSGPEVSARGLELGRVESHPDALPILTELAWSRDGSGPAPRAELRFNPISSARRARGDALDLTLAVEAQGEVATKSILDIRVPFLPAALGDARFGTIFALSSRMDRPEVVEGAELCVMDGPAHRHVRRMPVGPVSHLSVATRFAGELAEPGLMLRLFLRPFAGRFEIRLARGFVGQDYDPYLFNPRFERLAALRGIPDFGRAEEAKAEFLRRAEEAMALHDYRGDQSFLKPFIVARGTDPEFPMLIGTSNSLAWYAQDLAHRGEFYHHDGYVRDGGVVLDCGAHAGELSALFARTVGPQGKVIAFDPFPQNHLQVEAQAVLNETPWLTGVRAGVGSAHDVIPTELELQMTSGSGTRPGARSVFPLKIEPLDDYLDAAPSFIKVDVEGAEAHCLAGAQTLMRRHRPSLYVEVHPLFLRRFGQTPKDFFDTLPKDIYRVQYQVEGAPAGWNDLDDAAPALFEGKVGGYVRALAL